MATIENTVRLKAKFHSWDGSPADVNNIELTVYDKKKEEIDNITTDILNPSTGEYYYDYLVPKDIGYLVYEFKGELNGNVILNRSKLPLRWVGDR